MGEIAAVALCKTAKRQHGRQMRLAFAISGTEKHHVLQKTVLAFN